VRQCLLPGTRARARLDGHIVSVDAATLQTGSVLVSGCGTEATVRFCCVLPKRNRDVVTLRFQSEGALAQSLPLTANHCLPVLPPEGRRYYGRAAAEVRVGDRLRTHVGEVVVVKVEPNRINTKVTEIELDDPRSTMCVSSEQIFVEVYGELTPPHRDEAVRLLRFNRFERFRETLLESPELRACRDDLQRNGLSADMNEYELGAGKLFVQPSLAASIIDALRREGIQLRAGDVVVSSAFEGVVRELVRTREGVRPAHVLEERVLDNLVEQEIVVLRTFIGDFRPPRAADELSVVTQSTTAAHTRLPNPRFLGNIPRL